ncbi:MAG: hypothetical protein NTX22_11730 [Ignavibacteriales bacterium]|nr:hypothetical protein [Ignavibacteriales bacterium]
MKAIEQIKKKAGYFIALEKYGKKKLEQVSFKEFIHHSYDFLLIMPDDDAEFRSSLELVYSLVELKKNVRLFLRDFRVSLVKKKERLTFFDFGIKDYTKLYLPTSTILDNILDKKADVVIDLNLVEDIYGAVIAASVAAKFKISFQRGRTDKFYNLLLVNKENNPAFSYRNLLNSLQMFQ